PDQGIEGHDALSYSRLGGRYLAIQRLQTRPTLWRWKAICHRPAERCRTRLEQTGQSVVCYAARSRSTLPTIPGTLRRQEKCGTAGGDHVRHQRRRRLWLALCLL